MWRVIALVGSLALAILNLYWTQTFQHAEVFTHSPCLPALHGVPMETAGSSIACHITLGTDLLHHEYRLESHTTSVNVRAADVAGFAVARGETPFTWLTYTLMTAALAVMIWIIVTDPWIRILLKANP